MKYKFPLLFTLIFIGFSQSFGKETELLYQFKSDKESSEVPKGKCWIVGKAVYGNLGIEDVSIKTYDQKYKCRTNENGEFKLEIPAQEIQIYAYNSNYEEVVTPKYNFRAGHQVEVVFKMRDAVMMRMVEKPVIYMYAEEDVVVNIEIGEQGVLDFTYPKYEEGWNVKVQKEGGLIVDGKEYPYLFWDSKQHLSFNKINNQFAGFVVEKDSVVSFLEDKLTHLGLNATEQTDFITYWAPRMEKAKSVFIQFLIDEEYDEIAQTKITPKPDSKRRVFMKFANAESLDESKIIPQNLTEFERKGFVYLEWGGSEIQLDNVSKL